MSGSSSMSNTERAKRLEEKYKKEFPKGTPIVVACEKGRLEDLNVFVEGHDVEGTGRSVKQLLEEVGTNSDGYEMNALMAAAGYEQPEVLVQLLDHYKVDPTITNSIGVNALHFSAHNNSKSTICVESLLKKMPLESINKKNGGRSTPLDDAYGHNVSPIKNDIVQLIRQYGGKANWFDRNGRLVGEGNGDLNDSKKRSREAGDDDPVCIICGDNIADTVLVPCSHHQFCFDCAEKFKKCPICRGKIERIIRLKGEYILKKNHTFLYKTLSNLKF